MSGFYIRVSVEYVMFVVVQLRYSTTNKPTFDLLYMLWYTHIVSVYHPGNQY